MEFDILRKTTKQTVISLVADKNCTTVLWCGTALLEFIQIYVENIQEGSLDNIHTAGLHSLVIYTMTLFCVVLPPLSFSPHSSSVFTCEYWTYIYVIPLFYQAYVYIWLQHYRVLS